jgi:hypothetical protein
MRFFITISQQPHPIEKTDDEVNKLNAKFITPASTAVIVC